ncbi:MAG: Hsp70 family protein, partial [Spirochaetaceae bacterium]|nr:Hsp70 family protein [Spirochaetaceae bacterium]
MGKKIGIKLADGSFYPIMEDGVPQKKLMELTTVQDNQTTASIDLYRSESGTMDDAEYVDTLELSELKPHPGGETNMSFIIQLDENNMLSAEVCDPESGKTSVTKADLVNLPAENRTDSSDYTLSEIHDTPVSAPKKTSLGVDSFDLSDFDLDEFASLGDSHVDALLGKDDTLVPDDFEQPVAQEEPESFDLPDFEEPVAQEETASFDLPDFEATVAQEATESFDLPDFEEPVAQEETASFDLPDFGEPVAQEATESFDLPDFEEPVAQEAIESFDLPD